MRVSVRKEGEPASALRDHMIDECEAMAKYALGSGLRLQEGTARELETFIAERGPEGADQGEKAPSMPAQALSKGLDRLARLHESLARLVSPAKPRTILYLERERHRPRPLKFLGTVPLIRRLMLAAVLFLMCLICVSLAENVDGRVDWQHDHGWGLLLEELYLISAAGVGATFAALFRANRYIVDGTFDPKYSASYWTRIVLGVVAGMILALLIPIGPSAEIPDITKPTLAMLGGFSVAVVYRILYRLVQAVESLVRGDTHDVAAAKEQAARAAQYESSVRDQARLTARLMALERKLNNGISAEDAKGHVARLIGELNPDMLEDGAPGQTAGNGASEETLSPR